MLFEEGKKWMFQTQQWIFGGKKKYFLFSGYRKDQVFSATK